MFWDRVATVNNLNCNYIIGAAIQRSQCVATGFRIMGRHFLSVNGQMVAQSIPTTTVEPPNVNTNQIYKINYKFPPTKLCDTNRCSTQV